LYAKTHFYYFQYRKSQVAPENPSTQAKRCGYRQVNTISLILFQTNMALDLLVPKAGQAWVITLIGKDT
jgi:hypothetical protein